MNFSETILTTIITTLGVVVSAFISWFISRTTANKEMERIERTWEHEAQTASADEFTEMAKAVGKFSADLLFDSHADALALVASLRPSTTGDLGAALDNLYDVLQNCRHSKNRIALDHALAKVIQQKRKEYNSPGTECEN